MDCAQNFIHGQNLMNDTIIAVFIILVFNQFFLMQWLLEKFFRDVNSD